LSVRGDDGVRLKLDGKLLADDWSDHGARVTSAFVGLEAGRSYGIELEFYENGGAAIVQLGWRQADHDLVMRAAECARGADAAIVLVGDSEGIESEGFDRSGLALPEGQAELVRAVATANPRTIVVLLAGAPVTVEDWVDSVPALVDAWFPGQEGGTAIGEVLFGDVSPGGRLPLTFPRRWEDSPAHATYPGRDLATEYAEGVFVGYRHFDRAGVEPRYPFGFGLSYTTFRYGDLRVEPARAGSAAGAEVSFTLTNTGARSGAEVAQVYVRDVQSSVPRPVRELKAFERVVLAPGASRRVTLPLGERAFAFYDVATHAWRVEGGAFEIGVGASSRDIRLTREIVLP
jgi:beta-glucosidase